METVDVPVPWFIAMVAGLLIGTCFCIAFIVANGELGNVQERLGTETKFSKTLKAHYTTEVQELQTFIQSKGMKGAYIKWRDAEQVVKQKRSIESRYWKTQREDR